MTVPRLVPMLGLLLVLGACRRDGEIQTYRVPKDNGTPPPAATDPHAGMNIPGDPHAGLPAGATIPGMPAGDPHAALPRGGSVVQPSVTGEVPDHWEAAPGSSMRLASYLVKGDGEAVADISLVALSGSAGGVLDNVNRWRTQIGLEPVDQAGLDASSQKLDTPVGQAVVVDLEGSAGDGAQAKDGRIVAAIASVEGGTWFYKLRGNPDLVAREKEAFLRWIATAKRQSAESPAK